MKKQNSESLPIIIAVSIALTVFVGLSGIVMSFISSDAVQEKTDQEGTEAQDGFATNNQEEDKNILTAPAPALVAPPSGGNSDATELNSETGIPTGTYSNPPTTVKSSGNSYTSDTSTSEQNSPINNFGSSSVESNSLTQQNGTSGIPDYSSASPSNNYNSSSSTSLTNGSSSLIDGSSSLTDGSNSLTDGSNSLVDPAEDDTLLNSPNASSNDSTNLGVSSSESTGISSLEESP
jgi:X-X-X-Leu-X-X-Gly heptad repeat protein